MLPADRKKSYVQKAKHPDKNNFLCGCYYVYAGGKGEVISDSVCRPNLLIKSVKRYNIEEGLGQVYLQEKNTRSVAR